MENYRLTVHVENQPKVDTRPDNFVKKGTQKNAYEQVLERSAKDKEAFLAKKQNKNVPKVDNKGRYKVYTTLSFYCKSKKDCMAKLKSLQSEYTIAKGKDYKNKKKYNKELYNISFINQINNDKINLEVIQSEKDYIRSSSRVTI